ncbi:MAG TPA: DUF2254 domain-containing protein [Candidatus Aminicenantes bacterium]|nr:DUF2254 domain-containing protein [Candidatus Aminicenantes bacterium]
MKKLIFRWNELKSTFWFFPVLIILVAVGLALAFVFLDSRIGVARTGIGRYLFVGSADSARSVLTTISGAMIGVAGTVFSITLVALTLASSQFGPRLIRNFMYDRLNQVVLGSYIATYMYCLIVLNTIKAGEQSVFVPSVSVLLALLAAAANIVLLIVFIHHIAMSIQADNVISDISGALSRNLKTLFPEIMGDEADDDKEHDERAARAAFKVKRPLLASRSGYLQYVDAGALIGQAAKRDLLIELDFRPGDYLVYGVAIGTVYAREALDEGAIDDLQDRFIVGRTRTHQQDAEHTIHQMVEIAVRALSPGVNDPYTAIACVDNLTMTMAHLSRVRFPSKYRYDEEGKLRVIADALTYEGMLDAAFNQIRQFSGGAPAVTIRLMEALITINKFVKRPDHKRAVRKHAAMVLNMARKTFTETNDIEDLEDRSKLILGQGA